MRLPVNQLLLKLTFMIFNLVESCQRSSSRPTCYRNITTSREEGHTKSIKLNTTTGPPMTATSKRTKTTVKWTTTTESYDFSKVSCGTAVRDPEAQIIKGNNAAAKSWPWMGYLNGAQGLCGAFLITDRWAITAAHCLPAVYSVTFGQTDRFRWTEHGQVRYVRYEVMHDDYDHESKVADIAMVGLERPVNFTDHVRPICLPRPNSNYTVCYVTGWGREEPDDPFGARFLRQLKVRILPILQCAFKWMTDGMVVTIKQICLDLLQKEKGAGVCNGDSGSPLNCKSEGRYYAAGLASFVERGCEKKKLPDVFTRVLPYMDWINETMMTYTFPDLEEYE